MHVVSKWKAEWSVTLGHVEMLRENLSLTWVGDKAIIEYISGRQPSSYALPFGFELSPNSYSKMVLESILDPLNGSSTHQTQ